MKIRAITVSRPAGLVLGTTLALLLAGCGDSASDAGPSPGAHAIQMKAGGGSSALAMASDQFSVTGLTKVGETRVTRTVFEYTYKVTVKNNGAAASNVVATLVEAPLGTEIVDAVVAPGAIGAGASVTPGSDTIVIRHDRALPFDPAKLKWSFASASTIQLDPVKPAEIVVLPLDDLGFPNGADKVVASGAIKTALIKDGTLRFATPGDTGVDQEASFEVHAGGAVTVLKVLIQAQRPTTAVAYVEPSEDGSYSEAPPKLAVTGLGANNLIGGTPLSFKLEGVAGLDLADDSVALAVTANNAKINLHNYWTYDQASGTFSVSPQKMAALMSALPNGPLTLMLNFVSKDGEFAVSYDLLAIKQGAKLSGKIQSPTGQPVGTLAGRRILLKGFNNMMRADALIDANGNFSFEGVIPDTYQLTLDDLENPDVVSASTVIFANSTAANVTLTYALGGAGFAKAAGASSNAPFIASSVSQNGKAPAPRSAPSAPAAMMATPSASLAAGAMTFSASAASQNQTITHQISYEVPQGTKSVGAKVTVYTAEYPTYTTQQSQYNDTWSYSVVGLPGTALSANGSVNQSHYTQGTTTRTVCVDVTDQAKNGPFMISGAVSATNIGDSQLTTITTVELSLGCVGLKVSSAKFTSPNANGNPILNPINANSLPGPYLSIQQSAPDATHTVPLEIKFTPSDAKITEVNIGVSANGANPTFTADNLLSQPHVASAGRIKFSRLSLPAFPGGMSNGKVAVTVRIKGTVEGTEATSDPAEGGQVNFQGTTAFTPLYLAGAQGGLSGRRYNQPSDVGGDSWATKQTIDLLTGKPYRFDDISGMHVTQTATGRSILDHSGHSDGQQIDLRYADGSGGYTDTLGGIGNGSHIQALINAAAAEVAANAANKPQLATLQAWITANRAMLDAEAALGTTRRIYIGNSFIKRALVDGKFSAAANSSIPGIQPWAKPAIVQPVNGHLHHWHLSVTAHP